MQLVYGPPLNEVKYSRDETVAAVRDFYAFLTKMYLDESEIVEPPEGGWPSISAATLQTGKTAEVIDLLRHLPYIACDHVGRIQGAPGCHFANWDNLARYSWHKSDYGLNVITEGYCCENVPPHVVGLTSGDRENSTILLDTDLGVIYWPDYIGRIKDCTNGQIEDDAYEYAAENEAEWRADAGAWAIPDFFEILKDQFRELQFIPTSSEHILDIDDPPYGLSADSLMIPMLRDIYLQHGWPDLYQYRKRECLEAVERALKERYPDFYPWRLRVGKDIHRLELFDAQAASSFFNRHSPKSGSIVNMRIAILLGVLAAIAGAIADHTPHITKMPRAEPTATTVEQDPWQCITENTTQYADVPKPKEELLMALRSYGDELITTCFPTKGATTLPPCPFPPKSLWCGFSAEAPSTMLPAYTSYGSSASSWWAGKSSAVASVSKECPITWERVIVKGHGGGGWLNITIAIAECYADAQLGSESLPSKATVTTRSDATGISASSPTQAVGAGTDQSGATRTSVSSPTSTEKSNGALGRMQDVDMWVITSLGLAAAVANLAW